MEIFLGDDIVLACSDCSASHRKNRQKQPHKKFRN